MAKLFNLVGMTTATTGTGTMTLGSAISGYLTPALAGVADGDVVSYAINDGAGSEVGIGTYTAAGTTLSRTVRKSTNSNAAISLSGAALVYITPAAEDLRWRLSANTAFNVATTGSDTTGDGSSGNPWQTLQRAIDFVANNVDLNGFTVQINVAAGAYASGITLSSPWVGAVAGGSISPAVTINGDTTTPANVSCAGVFAVALGGSINVQGFQFTGGVQINVSRGGYVVISGNCTFAGTNAIQFQVGRLGHLLIASGYTVAGTTPQVHWNLVNNGVLIVNPGLTITVSGTPAFSNAFISCSKCTSTNCGGITFSGSATGLRYNVFMNGQIDTGGAGANYFPGNVAGASSTGGQYT
jgi:hypothetical protein